ncbi:MAG TPA: hypothetical protein VJT08_15700 [Terriglobales bacterium]|nr:hypothetical protein [Terriglobales bacterium]
MRETKGATVPLLFIFGTVASFLDTGFVAMMIVDYRSHPLREGGLHAIGGLTSLCCVLACFPAFLIAYWKARVASVVLLILTLLCITGAALDGIFGLLVIPCGLLIFCAAASLVIADRA